MGKGQFTVLLGICIVLLYLGFSEREVPKLHFHMHITSSVSSGRVDSQEDTGIWERESLNSL